MSSQAECGAECGADWDADWDADWGASRSREIGVEGHSGPPVERILLSFEHAILRVLSVLNEDAPSRWG